jgi:hypothetical protein
MTLTLDRAAPWELIDLDTDEALADLRFKFPGISIWRGEFTGNFFAAVLRSSRQDQLVEAATPDAFIRLLAAALRPRLPVNRPSQPIPARPIPTSDPCQPHAVTAPYQGRHQTPPLRGLWQRFAALWTTT